MFQKYLNHFDSLDGNKRVIRQNILVLGYYNRSNLGDEAYKIAIPLILEGEYNFTFSCTDDLSAIPEDVDIVICGGGDIINKYFMKKINLLLQNFSGPVYALSVGISYCGDLDYLNIFDHVFIRNKTDYFAAVKTIGKTNVTYLPDITSNLMKVIPDTIKKTRSESAAATRALKIGFALANPMINKNPAQHRIKSSIIKTIKDMLKKDKQISIFLLTFNYDRDNYESDFDLNNEIYQTINDDRVKIVTRSDPIKMIELINTLDLTICMRYHSAVFSLLTKTKNIILNFSPKMQKLVTDCDLDKWSLQSSIDNSGYPDSIDSDNLIDLIWTRIKSDEVFQNYHTMFSNSHELKAIISKKKYKNVLVKNCTNSLDQSYKNVKRMLIQYVNIDPDEYDIILHRNSRFHFDNFSQHGLAVLICYAITGQFNHACVWGLYRNMKSDDFKLFEAIDYIHHDCHKISKFSESYYPDLKIDRKIFINLDFIFEIDTDSYHRFGWNYVLGGMINLDGPRFNRKCNLLIDTHVDRSFHWGQEILETMNIIPYKQPWMGFVHHTFDTSSINNNVTLFNKPVFIESLSTCRGLFALSSHLATQLKNKLIGIGFENVPVFHLHHPMERVSNDFTLDKWNKNRKKRVIQVGAWLRNPYAIYSLPLTNDKNPEDVKKAVLKGKQMSAYFEPPHLQDNLRELLTKDNSILYNFSNLSRPDVSRPDVSRPDISRPDLSRPDVSRPDISRPDVSRPDISRPDVSRPDISRGDGNQFENKYCEGLYNLIVQNKESVEIIDTLSNESYDQLLSENIVFLNLIDASAVNTVLECLMRNTPLICNRLPAVEEVLGKHYPGFYQSPTEAVEFITNRKKIEEIYQYLLYQKKGKFSLNNFMNQFQKIVLERMLA